MQFRIKRTSRLKKSAREGDKNSRKKNDFSKQMRLYKGANNCFIRNRQVTETPEERVRQELLRKMVHELGFPKGLISVEKSLGHRRYDVVCYTPEMTPLLLVECKAIALTESAESQAFGYNATIKAPFICLVSPTEIKTLWQETGRIASVSFLPTYKDLYEISRRR